MQSVRECALQHPLCMYGSTEGCPALVHEEPAQGVQVCNAFTTAIGGLPVLQAVAYSALKNFSQQSAYVEGS